MKLKLLKYLIIFALIMITSPLLDKGGAGGGFVHSYFFGLKSADDTISNIQQIEEKYNMDIPIVAFIFDPRSDDGINTLNSLNDQLGETRIYHITLAPNNHSAKQVAEGHFDNQYRQFFQIIKENNLRIIFRTMHEMNGGRYPRSSDPVNFKKAWTHVRDLSREEGLDQSNILFDFSINHRDMPTKGTPSQTARLIPCQLRNKEVRQCYTFEDYYPGNKYVDIMGLTFYNRGKASYNRAWISPAKIANQRGRNTLDRLKSFRKPIFIDEVATTAVRYSSEYDQKKSIRSYKTNSKRKNTRILQLKNFMLQEPSIVGLIYFNVDYTNGLTYRPIGEADRSAININNGKVYSSIFQLYKKGEKLKFLNQLLPLFNIELLEINGIQKFVKSDHRRVIKKLLKIIETLESKSSPETFLDNMYNKGLLARLYKRFSNNELKEIIQETKKFILE